MITKNVPEFLNMTLQEIINLVPKETQPNPYFLTHAGAVSVVAMQGDCGYQFILLFTAENPEIPERFARTVHDL